MPFYEPYRIFDGKCGAPVGFYRDHRKEEAAAAVRFPGRVAAGLSGSDHTAKAAACRQRNSMLQLANIDVSIFRLREGSGGR